MGRDKGNMRDENNNMSALRQKFAEHAPMSKNAFKSYDKRISSLIGTPQILKDIRDDKANCRKVPYGCVSSCNLSVVSSAVPIQLRMEAQVDDNIRHPPSFHNVN